jgi:hypothetical protein
MLELPRSPTYVQACRHEQHVHKQIQLISRLLTCRNNVDGLLRGAWCGCTRETSQALSVALRGLYGGVASSAIFGNGCVTQTVSTTPYAVTPQTLQRFDQHKRNLQKKILDTD